MARVAKQIVCLWIAGVASLALAAPDVRILLDASEQMAQADPQGRRVGAMEVLLRMLPRDAHGGVWTYADGARALAEHGQVTGLWRQTAIIKLRGLGAQGSGSNLADAISAAAWDGPRDQAQDRHLIVLSAGGMNGAASRSELLVSGLAELQNAGVQVHTLGLGGSVDRVLLEQLALATDGYFAAVAGPEQLTGAVIKVLDHALPPTRLPEALAGTFQVDAGVDEITVLRLRKQDDADLVLQGPLGRRFSRTSSRNEVTWHQGDAYDLLSLRDPTPGDWRFRAGNSGDIRVLAMGDLALDLGGLAGVMFPGGPLTFALSLSSHEAQISDREFLELLDITAELETPSASQPLVVESQPEGAFALHLLELAESGDHVLRVLVRGPTFERQLVVPFVVRNPLTLDIRPAVDGALIWVDVRAPGIDPRTLQVAAKVRRPPAPAKVLPGEAFPAGLWKVRVTGTGKHYEVSLDISGNYLNGKEFSLKTQWLPLEFPVVAPVTVSLDATGKQIRAALQTVTAPSAPPGGSPGAPPRAPDAAGPGPMAEPELTLPLWFVAVVGVLGLMLVGAFWWMLKPGSAPHALPAQLAELREQIQAAQPQAA